MAVVVEQTIPFSPASLQLDNTERWLKLLSLLRPSTRSIRTLRGLQIVFDQNKLDGDGVVIVAIPRPGAMSTQLLDKRCVSAIVLGVGRGGETLHSDIRQALERVGFAVTKGLVTVQCSDQHVLHLQDEESLLVQTNGLLEFDHLLHLIGAATKSCRHSLHALSHLIREFSYSVLTTISTFQSKKVDEALAINSDMGLRQAERTENAVFHDLNALIRKFPTPSEACTWSVHLADLNGLSRLEIYITGGEIGKYFEREKLSFLLSQSTINNSKPEPRGYALSLCRISCQCLAAQSSPMPHAPMEIISNNLSSTSSAPHKPAIPFSDSEVRKRIVTGCQAVMDAEPTVTEYDTIVGDGDCGYTLRDGAKQVLRFIQDKDLGNFPTVLEQLVQDLEISMGGTSGALYCIYLTALAASLAVESSTAKASKAALEELLKYTRARVGDRTMMDVLIPFVNAWNDTNDVSQALGAATKGLESTREMQARLGRSTYLDERATHGVPDPGAYGLLILLQALSRV